MSGVVGFGMDKGSLMESDEKKEQIVDIYITAEAVRNMKHGNTTKDFNTQISENQTPQHTGSNSVKNRSTRAALVCLVLLCFLLLTAVIVLSVFIYTNNTNCAEERRQLITNITNITEDRDKLLTNITNLTEKRNKLLTNITNMTQDRAKLITNITNLTEKSHQLLQNNTNLLNETAQLKWKKENLLNQLKKILTADGWTYNQSSFYYKSNISKTWNASRSDCIARGADLIIINNQQEQDFVMGKSNVAAVWIGLNDINVEGSWRWVDGSAMKNDVSFWASAFNEPNGDTKENCVASADKVTEWLTTSGWVDVPCERTFQWICEKNISQLI